METNQKNETLVNLDLSEVEFKVLESMQKPGEDLNATALRIFTEKIKEAQKQLHIEVKQAMVVTLELVMQHVIEKEDRSELQHEIAADLLAAKAALEIEKTGTISKEKLKDWALELFS